MSNLETMDLDSLKYADYKYEHCDGNCEKCPCSNVCYDCSYIHDEIVKELQRRGE